MLRVLVGWITVLVTYPVCSVIAGNHDLSLHDEWYETHWHIYHTRRGKQVCHVPRRAEGYMLTARQRHGKALETLKGKKAKKAGIVYLDDEKYEFKLTGSDRTWSVYGTPVSFPLSLNISWSGQTHLSGSGVQNLESGPLAVVLRMRQVCLLCLSSRMGLNLSRNLWKDPEDRHTVCFSSTFNVPPLLNPETS